MHQIGYTGKIRIFLKNGKVKIGDKLIFRFSNSKPKPININETDLNELKDVLCQYMMQKALKELTCNLKSIVGIGGESIILTDPKKKNSVKKFIPLQNIARKPNESTEELMIRVKKGFFRTQTYQRRCPESNLMKI